MPLVAETTGAWDKGAARVLHIIAAAAAAREGVDPATSWATMLQELSVTARAFRARAALRRRAGLPSPKEFDAARAAALLLEQPAV
jgi:hypothetical protein